VLSLEEARLLNHSFIGTEHILLGLIGEDEGLGARTLKSFGLSLDAVRQEVEETIGVAGTVTYSDLPFTPAATKLLERARRQALQLGHSYVGTEHMLLGLAIEGQGAGATTLVSLGADLGRVRQEVLKRISVGEGPTMGRPVSDLQHASTRKSPSQEPCPGCGASVDEMARTRSTVFSDSGDPISIDLVYCEECGVNLEASRVERRS